MPDRSDILPQDNKAWMLAIGRRLRADYDAVAEPVPERLAALIKQLEAAQIPSTPEIQPSRPLSGTGSSSQFDPDGRRSSSTQPVKMTVRRASDSFKFSFAAPATPAVP
jgi:hypothetical protein